ncbi:MAG TPA: hypothetical protein VFV52_18425 [Bacilli bacterium]|nr:hypothetical protein [Bacilli bacterium]
MEKVAVVRERIENAAGEWEMYEREIAEFPGWELVAHPEVDPVVLLVDRRLSPNGSLGLRDHRPSG